MTRMAFPDKASRDAYIREARQGPKRTPLKVLEWQTGLCMPRLSAIANGADRRTARRCERDQRNERICLAYECRVPVKVIAADYGVTRQWVCAIVKAAGVPLRRTVRRRKADEIRYVGPQL